MVTVATSGDPLGGVGKQVFHTNRSRAVQVDAVVGDRVVKVDEALLDQREQNRGPEWFGQGGKMVRGVRRRWGPSCNVRAAEAASPDDALVPNNSGRESGDREAASQRVQFDFEPADPVEPVAIGT